MPVHEDRVLFEFLIREARKGPSRNDRNRLACQRQRLVDAGQPGEQVLVGLVQLAQQLGLLVHYVQRAELRCRRALLGFLQRLERLQQPRILVALALGKGLPRRPGEILLRHRTLRSIAWALLAAGHAGQHMPDKAAVGQTGEGSLASGAEDLLGLQICTRVTLV